MAKLGELLRERRVSQRKSLKEVARKAQISAAYLQKLETGAVASPSPNILHRLAQELHLEYVDLMQLAGYVVPSSERPAEGIVHALMAEDLTDDEATALATFLRHLRETKGSTTRA